jgi:hypothetical protein
VELQASTKLEVEKWMASFKKAPPPKKSAKELEAEGKMIRCLVEPKMSIPSDYKCTMILHGQSKIQMAYAPQAWEVGEPMVNEKRFDNSTQTRLFHPWYLQQVKRGRLMFGF